MLIFCTAQTTVERRYISAVKRITLNPVQTWATKTVNHHGT